jgi:hypothetical protein
MSLGKPGLFIEPWIGFRITNALFTSVLLEMQPAVLIRKMES